MAKFEVVTPGKSSGDPDATPAGLKAEGRRLWMEICSEWDISDAASRVLLEAACRQADRAAECEARIAKDGLTVKSRNGARPHPLLQTEISCRSFVTRALGRLGILFEPQKMPGRHRELENAEQSITIETTQRVGATVDAGNCRAVCAERRNSERR